MMHHRFVAMRKTLHAARVESGLTQVELAAAAECGLSTVSRHEKARTWPKLQRLRRRIEAALAKALAKAVAP